MELNHETIDTPPRDSASVLMLRDSAEGLQVLLTRRHTNAAVLGGACVFPGGKVDAQDAGADMLALLDRSPAQLHARLGEPDLAPARAAAFYVAAAREVFEEVGVLYHQRGQTEMASFDPDASAALRAGEPFATLLARMGCVLDTDALTPWSRWITPRQPSMMKKRFDTRFFLAAAPAAQTARHDGHEVTELLWLTPRQALTQYRDHRIDLAPPQVISLAHLARFDSVAAAVQDARQRPPPLIAPEPFDENGTRVLCLPGDARHSQPQRALPTPLRLRHTQGRFLPEEGFEAFFA